MALRSVTNESLDQSNRSGLPTGKPIGHEAGHEADHEYGHKAIGTNSTRVRDEPCDIGHEGGKTKLVNLVRCTDRRSSQLESRTGGHEAGGGTNFNATHRRITKCGHDEQRRTLSGVRKEHTKYCKRENTEILSSTEKG